MNHGRKRKIQKNDNTQDSEGFHPNANELRSINMNKYEFKIYQDKKTNRQKAERYEDQKMMNRTQKTSRRPPMNNLYGKRGMGKGGGAIFILRCCCSYCFFFTREGNFEMLSQIMIFFSFVSFLQAGMLLRKMGWLQNLVGISSIIDLDIPLCGIALRQKLHYRSHKKKSSKAFSRL